MKLKKAGDYIADKLENLHFDVNKNMYLSETDVIDIIKQMRVEAIEYTVKRCAEEANVNCTTKTEEGIEEFTNKSYINCTIYEENEYTVDIESILNVANKIKEEL